jgi:hypothetical protein
VDGAEAVAAYETIIKGDGGTTYFASQPGRGHAALDQKALRDGAPLLKRRVLSTLEQRDLGARRTGIIIDALLKWDFEKAPISGDDLEVASVPVVLSLRSEHADRLRALTKREPESIRMLAMYGLAVLGDAYCKKRTLQDFQQAGDWRLLATSFALARSPDAAAEPRLKELLSSGEKFKLRAGFAALSGFPNLDVKKELGELIEFDDAAIQTLALRAIVARSIDLADRVWKVAVEGKLKDTGPQCGFDPIPIYWPFREVGPALMVPDDPSILDRLAEQKDKRALFFVPETIRTHPPPRIRARLKALATGKVAPGEKSRYEFGFLEETLEKSESVDEVLDFIEALGHRKNYSPLHTALYYADPQTPSQKDRIVAMCRGWLGQEGHPLRFGAGMVLHRWGMKEGTEDLLEVARARGREGMRCLSVLGVTPETKPLILEHLKGPDPFMAIRLLSLAKDEIVIPRVIEAFKAGQMPYVGGDGGLAGPLKQFKMRDLTDDLVGLLDGTPHQAHIVAVISYLRWRERKDKAALVRNYLSHPYVLVLEEAAGALADWKDQESFGVMEKLLKGSDSDRMPRLLLAMMRLDRDRAWPHFKKYLPFLSSNLPRFATVFPKPGDARIVRRLLQTNPYAGVYLPRVAGKMFGAEVADALLVLAEDGNIDAATGLAYAGDARGIAAIASQIDDSSPVKLLNALDLLVNAAKLSPPGRVKSFSAGPQSGDEGAKQVQEAFGVEVAFPRMLAPRVVSFEIEQDLLESLERLGAGRYPRAHITRNGRVEFIPLDEARDRWINWRDANLAK